MIKHHPLMFLILFLSAATSRADVFVRDDIITEPTPSRFSLCYDHDCEKMVQLKLKSEQWAPIQKLFSSPSANAAQERKKIAGAIARLETIMGEMTGTSADRGGTFPAMGKEYQMDCIDESINTSTYLRMLHHEELLRWHTVEDRAARGLFILQWPHSTAVIRETGSEKYYAVDSWFHDNGKPPEILPLEQWKSGWKPK